MFAQPFRIHPNGPAEAYKTYQIITPQTPEHYRSATCEEVDCEHWLNGWVTRIPPGSALEDAVHASGRRWVEIDGHPTAAEVSYTFPPGTVCFRASTHRVRTDKPGLFIVRGGDWRGNPRGDRRVHARPEDWVEDFSEHTSALKDQLEKG